MCSIMPKRICDSCGKEKDISGGRTCENGHFLCRDCVYGSGIDVLIFGTTKKICPLCKKPLR